MPLLLLLLLLLRHEHNIKIKLTKSGKYKLSYISQVTQKPSKTRNTVSSTLKPKTVSEAQHSFLAFFWLFFLFLFYFIFEMKKKAGTVMNNIIINKNYKFVVVNIS